MTIVDTNVVSEILKPTPAPQVRRWFFEHTTGDLVTTAITKAELLLGAALLSPGRRRAVLEAALDKLFAADFAGRVLPFDEAAASEYPRIVLPRRAAGRPISLADAQIAAIARAHGATLATRNTADFEGCGLRLVNPFTS
jgi:hypothetical protein